MGRPAKHLQQRFDGITYYEREDGYFKAPPNYGGEYLHRAVWAKHHGSIPDGFEVHHIDEIKANCAIGNLELKTSSAHSSDHSIERWASRPMFIASCLQCGEAFAAKVLARAKFCSGSCRAIARMKSGVDDENRPCRQCGTPFTVNKNREQPCCSLSCAASARWARRRETIPENAR